MFRDTNALLGDFVIVQVSEHMLTEPTTASLGDAISTVHVVCRPLKCYMWHVTSVFILCGGFLPVLTYNLQTVSKMRQFLSVWLDEF